MIRLLAMPRLTTQFGELEYFVSPKHSQIQFGLTYDICNSHAFAGWKIINPTKDKA